MHGIDAAYCMGHMTCVGHTDDPCENGQTRDAEPEPVEPLGWGWNRSQNQNRLKITGSGSGTTDEMRR